MTHFEEYGYEVVKNVIHHQTLQLLDEQFKTAKKVVEHFHPNSKFGDGQVDKSFSQYGFNAFEALLVILQPEIEKVLGFDVYPAYSYARIYYNGASMAKHIDRPSCEYSATVSISIDETPWPIFFKDLKGDVKELILYPGDICVYQGTKLEHWREEYKEKCQVQTFLHYVNSNGPYKSFKYDRRPLLGISKR